MRRIIRRPAETRTPARPLARGSWPGRGRRALAAGLLAWLIGIAGGCTGTGAARPLDLVFEQSSSGQSFAAGLRPLARRAAAVYVKVTILGAEDHGTGARAQGGTAVVSGASGIIVDPSGLVVTAAHIARSPAFSARVATLDGRQFRARIVHVDAERELALLRLDTAGSRLTAVRQAATARKGATVIAIGTPDNRPGVVVAGRVAQPRADRRIRYGKYGFDRPLELEMPASPGHSGGPVFDLTGRLTGMIIGFDLRRTGSGRMINTGTTYAVPAEEIMAFVAAYENGRSPE